MSKPNILLFMVDQLTSFVLSAYGGQTCRTPNIDALAARGTVFETAYCPYPLCAPSRFGMMAGRLPSRIGAFDNGAEFAASTPTFAHYLRAGGYYTMDMAGAAYAAKRYFDFKTVIPCHYRTFPLLEQSAQVLADGLPGVNVIEPQVMEAIDI